MSVYVCPGCGKEVTTKFSIPKTVFCAIVKERVELKDYVPPTLETLNKNSYIGKR